MIRRLIGLALVLLLISSPVQAATVVYTDSGNIGNFQATNTGVDGLGTATIVFGVPSTTSQMNTVNGAFIAPELVSINTPVTMLVTPSGVDTYGLALVPATYHKTIGATAGAQAILDFSLTTGTVTSLPAFFNVSGPVTGVSANLDPLFDFSQFATGLGSINLTFTATTFSGGATSFRSFLSTAGATAVGNGSFSQAVPEPASLAMLSIGIGICGLVLYRRRRMLIN